MIKRAAPKGATQNCLQHHARAAIFERRMTNMGISLHYHFPIFHRYLSIHRHGLTRQGQKTCAVKPGLRTGKVGVTRSYGNRYCADQIYRQLDVSPGKHHAIFEKVGHLLGSFFCLKKVKIKRGLT